MPRLCLERVEEQKQDFIRFGVLGDWDHPYLTLHKQVEVAQIGVFGKMAKKGYIYKGLKTVYWCPHCETALAEAEIEYKDDKSFSIYVKFQAVDLNCHMPKGADPDKVFALIWTTTPWTIPANMAICANENFEYVWVKIGEEYLLMAKELVEATMKAGKAEDYEVLPEVMTASRSKASSSSIPSTQTARFPSFSAITLRSTPAQASSYGSGPRPGRLRCLHEIRVVGRQADRHCRIQRLLYR